MATSRAIIVGISGGSSSGKTTLARLLRDLFPRSFILHEDDFYRPEAELPLKAGVPDWDCAASLDLPRMQETLTHIRSHGELPHDHPSHEDQNSVGPCPVSQDDIALLQQKVRTWQADSQPGHDFLSPEAPRICLLDGFLLYGPSMAAIRECIDIKLLLQVSHAKVKARREARSGYVTLEGFWEDPPGYVDQVVWPNYVAEHGELFAGGDVEGPLKDDVARQLGLRCIGGCDAEMSTILPWAVDLLMTELPLMRGS